MDLNLNTDSLTFSLPLLNGVYSVHQSSATILSSIKAQEH